MSQKMRFSELFQVANGMVTPKVTVHINGVTMGPGVSFGGGISFGGIDLTKYVGKDFDVEIKNNVYVIKGIYATKNRKMRNRSKAATFWRLFHYGRLVMVPRLVRATKMTQILPARFKMAFTE